MTLLFTLATPLDVAAVVAARGGGGGSHRRYGRGHWSSVGTEKSVLRDIRLACAAGVGRSVTVGTARLAAKRPWAIYPAYFTAAGKRSI